MINNRYLAKFFNSLMLLLNKKDFVKLFYIFILTFISIFFELLGIGLVIPLIEIFINDIENSYFYPYIIKFFSFDVSKDQALYILLFTFFFTFILKNLITIYINYHQTSFRFSIMANLSKKIYINYLNKDFKFFKNNKKIALVKDVIEESNNVSHNIIFQILNIISDLLIVFSILTFLIFSFFTETLFLASYFFVMSILYYYFVKKKLLHLGSLRYEQLEKRYQSLLDGFSSFIQIKLNKKEHSFLKKFQVFNKSFFKISMKYSVLQLLPKYLFEISFALFFLILIIISKNISYDLNSLIILISVYSVAGLKLLPSIGRIIISMQTISYALPVMENFKEKFLESTDEEIINKTNSSSIKVDFNKKIAIQNLSFSYGKKDILNNLSFEVDKGSILGFKGNSGVGKSTLFYILMGFLRQNKGQILIDDRTVDLNNDNWKNKIGYLSSDTYLLDESIKNNIIFTDYDKIDNKLLNDSIKLSELESFVNNLPAGVNTFLGDNGAKISTGQKQRLGLARLFYSNKNLIFLDEATNSLDKITEKKIFENLRLLNKNSTKFIISHDNTNLDLCDKVIEIKL